MSRNYVENGLDKIWNHVKHFLENLMKKFEEKYLPNVIINIKVKYSCFKKSDCYFWCGHRRLVVTLFLHLELKILYRWHNSRVSKFNLVNKFIDIYQSF